MSVTGHDSLKARRSLEVDGKRYDYFSLDAAAQGGGARRHLAAALLAEDPPGKPGAAGKRPHRHGRRHQGGRAIAHRQDHRARDRVPPGARPDAGSDRRAGGRRSRGDARGDGRSRRRSQEDQPAVAGRSGHRPFGAGRRFRQRRGPLPTTSRSSSSATASATAFCAGARKRSTISAWCRRAPASAIRSTSNTWRRWCGRPRRTARTIAYPDTLVGTDSHTTMVNGLSVLGWGVGGIEAEAAMLGQPISMLIPEVVGVRLTGRCARARPRPIWCSPSPRCCGRGRRRPVCRIFRPGRRRIWRSPTARRSATWRRNTARPAASSRSTPRRSAI